MPELKHIDSYIDSDGDHLAIKIDEELVRKGDPAPALISITTEDGSIHAAVFVPVVIAGRLAEAFANDRLLQARKAAEDG